MTVELDREHIWGLYCCCSRYNVCAATGEEGIKAFNGVAFVASPKISLIYGGRGCTLMEPEPTGQWHTRLTRACAQLE